MFRIKNSPPQYHYDNLETFILEYLVALAVAVFSSVYQGLGAITLIHNFISLFFFSHLFCVKHKH